MKRQYKWLLFVGISLVVAACTAYLGYEVIWTILDIKKMESRRPILLYQTDHQALLEACKEISGRVKSGEIKRGTYYKLSGDFDPEKQLFPKLILDIEPSQVYIEDTELVELVISPVVTYWSPCIS